MRVLLSSTSGWGHVHPMLPLAVALRDRGNAVVFATAEDARERVESAGVDVIPAGRPMAERMQEFQTRHPAVYDLPPSERPLVMFPWLFGEVSAPTMLRDLLPAATKWDPDVIVNDAADLAAPIVAASLNIPNVTHSFGTPIPESTVALAGREVAALWQDAGLDPRPYGGLFDHLYLDILPPSFHREIDLSYLGRMQPLRPSTGAGSADALPTAIAAMVASGRPLVYVTFGTLFNENPTFVAAVEALGRDSALRTVVTVGPAGDVDALGRQPDHVLVQRYIPQSSLLPHCALVVSHAGSGTLLGSLALGVPQLLLPQAADQFRNADACERTGVGIVLSIEDADADAIERAVRRLLSEGHFRANAQAIQAEIAAMPSPDDVAVVIEAL